MNKNEKIEDLAERLRVCAGICGGVGALAQKSAIPRRTIDSYLAGSSEPKWSNLRSIGHAAGVSFEWLVAGEGPMRGGDVAAPDQQAGYSPEEAEKELQAMEAIIETSYDKIQKNPSKFNELRNGIEQIAIQTNLDDAIRAQADNLLYLVFEDTAAAQRREVRFSKITMQMRERAALVSQAVDISGVAVNPAILELVKTLVLPGEPDASDIARLFKAIDEQSQKA